MKKGISDAVFLPKWDVEHFFRKASQAEFEGVELNFREEGGSLTPHTTLAEARNVVKVAKDYELEIATLSSSLLNNYPLSAADNELRNRGIEIGTRMIELAAEMGTEVIQLVPGVTSKDTLYHEGYDYAAESLFQLGEKAATCGVTIGIENVCNKFLPSPREYANFLNDINHSSVQAYFDNGNALVTGYIEHFIDLIGDKIVAIHLKDYRQSADDFVSILSGDTNWASMMKALQRHGYDGYLISTPPYSYDHCNDRQFDQYSKDLNAVLQLLDDKIHAG